MRFRTVLFPASAARGFYQSHLWHYARPLRGTFHNRANAPNVPRSEPNRIKDEDTFFEWSKYVAFGAHSGYERIIREKNTAIDTNVKILLSPKAEDSTVRETS